MWKASKCLKSSGVCRGLVGRVREASRGLGVLEAGPAGGGRRAGSAMRSQRAVSHLCCQNERFLQPGQEVLAPSFPFSRPSGTQLGKQSHGVYSSSVLGRRATLFHRQSQHSDPKRHSKGAQPREGSEESGLTHTHHHGDSVSYCVLTLSQSTKLRECRKRPAPFPLTNCPPSHFRLHNTCRRDEN